MGLAHRRAACGHSAACPSRSSSKTAAMERLHATCRRTMAVRAQRKRYGSLVPLGALYAVCRPCGPRAGIPPRA